MGRHHRWNSVFTNAVATLPSDSGGGDPGEFMFDEQFPYADTAALQTALTGGKFTGDSAADGCTMDDAVQFEGHSTMKADLRQNTFLVVPTFPSENQSGRVWTRIAVRCSPTLYSAEAWEGGANSALIGTIVRILEDANVDSQDVNSSLDALSDPGDPPLTILTAHATTANNGYNDPEDETSAPHPYTLDDLRGVWIELVALNEVEIGGTVMRSRGWLKFGAGEFAQVRDLNVDTTPDVLQTWRDSYLQFGKMFGTSNDAGNYIHVGCAQFEDAERTADPFGVL